MSEHRAYIGLGANLGDPAAALRHALAALRGMENVRLDAVSSFYRSAALDDGARPAASEPDYLNAVAALSTSLTPLDLLKTMQSIEKLAGRVRTTRNAARTLDLDLLLFDDLIMDTPVLQLPHPRMCERRFVLEPLLEIAPNIHITGMGGAAALLAASLAQRVERVP